MEAVIDKPKNLTWLAQRLILAELNHCFDGKELNTEQLAEFMGYDQQALRKAINCLEGLGIAKREFRHREPYFGCYLHWNLHGKELWNAAVNLLRCPVIRHYNVVTPSDMSDFTPSTESLLAERHFAYVLRSRPVLAYRGRSHGWMNNEKHITRTRPTAADYIVEFWAYPPLLPGLKEMDNLSLWTALQTPRNPILALYGGILVDQFDFDGHHDVFRRPQTRKFAG